jgi:hypothetical protein
MEFSSLNIEDFLKEKGKQGNQNDTPTQIQTKAFIGTWKETKDPQRVHFSRIQSQHFHLERNYFARSADCTTKVLMFGHMLLGS